jgi:putative IMPACT (imprinted ancient) family translation regulator
MTDSVPGPDDFFEPAPAKTGTAELKVKRSLFIGTLAPCGSAEAAREVLARAEALYRDADHHCWAYRLDPDSGTVHSSDGGEPAGTAGKPILAAIRRSGLFNVTIVVTRDFGGIKLGTRGLIDAYGQTAADAASRAGRVPNVRKRKVIVRLPYAAIGDVAHLLSAGGTVGAPAWRYDTADANTADADAANANIANANTANAGAEAVADVRASGASRLEAALDELLARKRIYSWNWLQLP